MIYKHKITGEEKDWSFSEWLSYITNPKNEEKYECSLEQFMERVERFRGAWEAKPKLFFVCLRDHDGIQYYGHYRCSSEEKAKEYFEEDFSDYLAKEYNPYIKVEEIDI